MAEDLNCPVCGKHAVDGHADNCRFGDIERLNSKLHRENAAVHRAVLDHCKRADNAEAENERLRTSIFTTAMAAETTNNVDVIRNMLRHANEIANPKASAIEPAKE